MVSQCDLREATITMTTMTTTTTTMTIRRGTAVAILRFYEFASYMHYKLVYGLFGSLSRTQTYILSVKRKREIKSRTVKRLSSLDLGFISPSEKFPRGNILFSYKRTSGQTHIEVDVMKI